MSRAGFTLVELLIAMLILTIGIMAVLSMQFTALGSAVSSRDNSNAADLARRLMFIMRMEGQQWRVEGIDVKTAVSQSTYSDSAFVESPLLKRVAENADFVSLFSQPLDARMSTQGVTRYCAFGRGRAPTTSDLFQIQLAIVSPAANGVIEGNDCNTIIEGGSPITLDPKLDPVEDTDHAQRHGYRVQYFDTQIKRRGHLN